MAVVRAIIGLAHGLELGIVAEGIETEEQAAALKALGGTYGQGFAFAKPLARRAGDALHPRRRPAEDRAASATGTPAGSFSTNSIVICAEAVVHQVVVVGFGEEHAVFGSLAAACSMRPNLTAVVGRARRGRSAAAPSPCGSWKG